MTCTSCGYENQAGHRFCGMCGTPLPHPPFTTPGAQSTLNLTRVPHETRMQNERGGTTVAAEPIVQETPAHTADTETARPDHDMVPEIPLDEYIRQFHYTPPTDPAEITMRGDVSVPETAAASSSAGAPVHESVQRSASEITFPMTDDLRQRLGLDPSGPTEDHVDRPRFLVQEPAATPEDPAIPSRAIAGPSFLGLSDTPVKSAGLYEAEESRSSRWRMWLAAGVVVIFGILGLLEWRSRANQTDHEPIQVITTKIRDLWHGKSADSNVSPAAPAIGSTPSSTDKGSAPASANKSQPPVAQNSPGAKPGAMPPALGAAAPASAKATKPGAQTPAVTPRTPPAEGTSVASKSGVPGQDEVLKARNASDTAAEAAWLWKATAKGNPDAPVRLADMYVRGDGVPRSCVQAMVLLKTAAEKTNVRARSRLASMYASGTCVSQNLVQAYRWYGATLAANPDNQAAQQSREQLWRDMTPEERGEAAQYR